MKTKRSVAVKTTIREDERDWDAFMRRIQDRFMRNIADGKRPLFTTDADGLFAIYLDSLPKRDRQYHTCHACRQFFERFAGLVVIDDTGRTESAIWSEEDAPDYYADAVTELVKAVRKEHVTGVFLSKIAEWGQHVTAEWTHYAVTPPKSILHREVTLTAGQRMAEKREDFKNVSVALGEFGQEAVKQALTILEADALYRSEKVLGAAQWLANLHHARSEAKGKQARENVLWLAIATAPAGFCHPRSSMIGTLLEDIASGQFGFDEIARRFADKMHPLRYQRPQAAPTAGAIAQAEKLVEQMGIAASLKRRFAKLEDIHTLWKPSAPQKRDHAGGVFSHLSPREAFLARSVELPAVVMTWDKFQRAVLGDAAEIDYFVPHGSGNYTAFVTALDPEAPPILQWDKSDKRNPVSWYVWHGGSYPTQWGLTAGTYVKVNGIALSPCHWFEPDSYRHFGQTVAFILNGAKDTRQSGLALFPECLKSELHSVRSVIEAHSHSGKIDGMEEASACGIALPKASTGNWQARFRVTDKTGNRREYVLDRWD